MIGHNTPATSNGELTSWQVLLYLTCPANGRGNSMNQYAGFENYTQKEIDLAAEILECCDGSHSTEEVINSVSSLAGELSIQERENIIEIINKAYTMTHPEE